jgi:hypothetical protein
LKPVEASTHGDQVVTVGGQALCEGLANPGGGSGDEGELTHERRSFRVSVHDRCVL